MNKLAKKQIMVFLILFVFLGSSISYAILYIFPGANNSASIDGVECSSSEQLAFHIHAHLDVFVNGQPSAVPAGIGIANTCLYWLHTHDDTGIIHIESPKVITFTLGQFMNIWRNSSVGSVPTEMPTVYVNGDEQLGNYQNTPLNAHDEIVLVYGTIPNQIPSSYVFPPGL